MWLATHDMWVRRILNISIADSWELCRSPGGSWKGMYSTSIIYSYNQLNTTYNIISLGQVGRGKGHLFGANGLHGPAMCAYVQFCADGPSAPQPGLVQWMGAWPPLIQGARPPDIGITTENYNMQYIFIYIYMFLFLLLHTSTPARLMAQTQNGLPAYRLSI